MTVNDRVQRYRISLAWPHDIMTDGQDFFKWVVLLMGISGGLWGRMCKGVTLKIILNLRI
jgi:hypothetical protein